MYRVVVIKSTATCQCSKLLPTMLCAFKSETNLSYPVVLQFDDSGHCHLHAAKYRNNFQDFIIEWWSPKYLKGKENIPYLMVSPVLRLSAQWNTDSFTICFQHLNTLIYCRITTLPLKSHGSEMPQTVGKYDFKIAFQISEWQGIFL